MKFPPTDTRLAPLLERVRPGRCEVWPHAFDLDRFWTDPPSVETLTVTYRAERSINNHLTLHAALGQADTVAGFDELVHVSLSDPVALAPVVIPKPWGEEIWFTGIEARGESSVAGVGGQIPLSVYLALAPERLCGGVPPTLLKILAPMAEAVRGDLYFEVHDTKKEVYVVTGVDKDAWPSAKGQMRFGMNQDLRHQLGDARFRAAYLEAVKTYESVRRAIDDGPPGDDREALKEQEVAARNAMNNFTGTAELAVGDVVVVPTWLPHSLQHGVRVVEFQTPSYERHILSFAQKVQTQDHWDTDRVIDEIRLDQPPLAVLELVEPAVERIVQFDDFGAWRVRLEAGSSWPLPTHIPYAIVMAVAGTATLGGLTLETEQAAFMPGVALSESHDSTNANTITNKTTDTATILIAAPDL